MFRRNLNFFYIKLIFTKIKLCYKIYIQEGELIMNGTITVSEKDELIMKLVHYFVTKENYAPIMVNGVKNEIWLENLDAYYKIVRINSNYIHNRYK